MNRIFRNNAALGALALFGIVGAAKADTYFPVSATIDYTVPVSSIVGYASQAVTCPHYECHNEC